MCRLQRQDVEGAAWPRSRAVEPPPWKRTVVRETLAKYEGGDGAGGGGGGALKRQGTAFLMPHHLSMAAPDTCSKHTGSC